MAVYAILLIIPIASQGQVPIPKIAFVPSNGRSSLSIDIIG